MKREKLEDYVTSIPDFPEPGIIFRDITTILQDPDGFHMSVDGLLGLTADADYDGIVALEARGFIFGTPVAYAAGKSFIPIRKKGQAAPEDHFCQICTGIRGSRDRNP